MSEIRTGIAVGRKTHQLPFIADWNKPELLRELRVKKAQRVGPRNRKHVIEPAAVAIRDGACFPGAAAVHHNDGSIVESGIRISADGMG